MDKDKDLAAKVWYSIIAFTVVIAGGTAGYMLLQGWDFLDSLFMTVQNLATIGFGEVRPLDETGRVFTIVLIVFGVGTVAYAIKSATRLMLEGELRDILGRRKLEQKIKQLKDHYIVCGFGRMGRLISRELA